MNPISGQRKGSLQEFRHDQAQGRDQIRPVYAEPSLRQSSASLVHISKKCLVFSLAAGMTILNLSACQNQSSAVKPDKPAPEGTTYAASEDLELKKARIDALEHFEEFRQAFKNKKPGEKFAVKAAFKDGDQEVHKWLIVDQMDNLDIVGHFASGDPQGTLQAGQQATARVTFIDDWSYIDKDGGEHGGYGLAVLRKRQKN